MDHQHLRLINQEVKKDIKELKQALHMIILNQQLDMVPRQKIIMTLLQIHQLLGQAAMALGTKILEAQA